VIIKADLDLFLKYLPKMHIHPSSPNSSLSEDDAAVKIQAGWKGYRVRKQLRSSRKLKNGQNGVGRSDDQALQEKSAAKIQAGWKGFKIRKELQNAKKAATTIQANWKGFKTRKEFKTKKEHKSSNNQ
jgi:hypothetical protein